MTRSTTGAASFARKRFGQNFLEPAWVAKVVRAIDPQPDQSFIEIGPGRGALTRELTARANTVVAYEIDRGLAAELRDTAPPNLSVVEGDFLATVTNPQSAVRPSTNSGTPEPVERRDPKWRIAGNLPYNVASPILFKLVDLHAQGMPVADATVMLQREVAERLLANPGTKDYGVLTVLIRHSADVTRLLALPPGAFRPAPKVHSSLVRLTFRAPEPPVRDLAVFRALVQAVFTRRRKTLANALLALQTRSSPAALHAPAGAGQVSDRTRSGAGAVPERGYSVSSQPAPADALARAAIDGSRRPETLSIAEFARLADVYASVWP